MTIPYRADQNAAMTEPATAIPLDPRIARIAAEIRVEIPDCEVRLFGSYARGTARADSDADLLITVPDAWLAGHDRLQVLGALWRKLASHHLPLDLLLYSQAEVRERAQYRSAVTTQAYQEGILLNG